MEILVNDIPESGYTVNSSIPKADFYFEDDDVKLHEPVTINITIKKSSKEIFIKGKVKTCLELECSICLENFLFYINENFEAYYIHKDQESNEEEMELNKDDMDVSFFEGDSIDLTDVIREQILLAVPMTPVCKSSCRGLCPNCGQNLNQGKCACRSFSPDSRWSALSKLDKKT